MEQRLTPHLVNLAKAIMDEPDAEFYGAQILRELDFPGGVGYPLLERLEKTHNQLESRWDLTGPQPRRYYKLTEKGRTDFTALLERAKEQRRFQHIFADDAA